MFCCGDITHFWDILTEGHHSVILFIHNNMNGEGVFVRQNVASVSMVFNVVEKLFTELKALPPPTINRVFLSFPSSFYLLDTEILLILARCVILKVGLFSNAFLIVLVFTTRGLPLRGRSLSVSPLAIRHATICTTTRLTLRSFAMSLILWDPRGRAAISILLASILIAISKNCTVNVHITLLKHEL